MFSIVISEPADQDLQLAYEWWRDHRSSEQASRWFSGILAAIKTLRQSPDRCPAAPETDLHPDGLKELHFGLGRRPTHRIVFRIADRTVIIVRVRHFAQQDLTPDDLA